MKRLILLGLCISAAAAVATADVRALYRIVMADGRVVLARDLPRSNGSVTTFHANGSGALTGVPSEEVVKIETSVTPRRFPRYGPAAAEETDAEVRPLQPGDEIDLGPTGDGGSGAPAGQPAVVGAGSGGANGGNANSAYGNGAYGYGGNPANGTFDIRMLGGGAPANLPLAGDVLRAQSGNVPTMSLDTATQTSNIGFPATISDQTALVNADGTPNIGPNGFPGTPQPVVGTNGFPGTAGQAAAGPNGFPGTPQTTTGTNGFPTTGVTGTATGSNGFPVNGTTGASTPVDSNGFPSTPATAAGTVVVAPNGTVTNVAPNMGASNPATGTVSPQLQPQRAQAKSGRASAAPSGPGGHGR
jgi:hypothetical protein